MHNINVVVFEFIVYFSDHFIQFGKSLGVESGELEKVWRERALGRYLRAIQSLVMNTLKESQNPVEKLRHALSQMKTPESARRALQAVQKGCTSFNSKTPSLIISPYSGHECGLPHCAAEESARHSCHWPTTEDLR